MTSTKTTRGSTTSSTSKRGRRDAAELWPTHGPLAVRWIEANLGHAEGDFFGRPFRLTRTQKRRLYRWYEYHPGTEDDRGRPIWRHNEALFGDPRGDGKTEFVSAVVCLEFGGPPEIAPASPNIPVAAASFEQADLVFGTAGTMLGGKGGSNASAPLAGFFEVFDTEILFADGRPGRIYRVAAVAGTNEGGRPTLFVADELHEWTGARSRVFTVLAAGTMKRRNARVLSISTAGVKGSDSLCELKYRHGRQLEHEPAPDSRFLFEWNEASPHWDLADETDVKAAIAEASPDTAGLLWDVDDRAARFFDPTVPRYEAERYFLNRWVEADDESWLDDLPPGTFAGKAVEGLEPPPDVPLVLGVDSALRHDSVALAACWFDGVRWCAVTSGWVPEGGHKVDARDVRDAIIDLGNTHTVDRVAYDPRFFELHAAELEDRGFNMVEFPQSTERMSPACRHAYDLIAGDDGFAHDGDPELERHVRNAARRDHERGWTLTKKGSKGHIDRCIALVMALYEAAAGETPAEPAPPAIY